MAQPFLRYTLPSKAKVSYADGFNTVSFTISSDNDLVKLIVVAVHESKEYGFIENELVDRVNGQIILELDNQEAGDYTATINTVNHFTDGEGNYRIGLYAQNSDGIWNYEYFLVDIDEKFIQTNEDKYVLIPVQTN